LIVGFVVDCIVVVLIVDFNIFYLVVFHGRLVHQKILNNYLNINFIMVQYAY
jgi:hypothetical protein